MARPRCNYKIGFCPKFKRFKPDGFCAERNGIVELTSEETEALRLKHMRKLDQAEAAKKMNVSRSTFQRVLAAAHEKVSDALIKGKAIKI